MSQPTPVAPMDDHDLKRSGGLLPPALQSAISSIIGPLIGLVLVILIFGVWRPGTFLQGKTFVTAMDENLFFAVAAVGMTFVVITAGIDLSVGSTMALSCVMCAMAIRGFRFPAREVGTTLGIGLVVGVFTALCAGARAAQAGRHARAAAVRGLAWGAGVGAAVAIVWLLLAGRSFAPMPAFLAALIGIGAGALVGYINGSLVTSLQLPPFIVTLATLEAVRGFTLYICNDIPISRDKKWDGRALDAMDRLVRLDLGSVLGLSPNIWISILVILVGIPILHFTILGRYAYAIGSNERTARLCGVHVERYKTLCYLICGITAGLAGVMFTARSNGGQPTSFPGAELTVIAAVVIGGTSLFGGEGTIVGTMIGVLMLGLLRSGCVIADISTNLQRIFIGGTIVLAAALDRFRHMRK